jgi:hypothetical protein
MVVAAAAVLLLFALPGFALGPSALPEVSTPLARLGRALGLSLVTGMVVCMILTALGLLTGPLVAASLVAITTLGFAVRRPRLGLPGRRRRRWWAGAIAGIAVAILLVVAPSRAAVGPEMLPLTSTTWYYANLAQTVAAAGRIPAGVAEWGAIRPFPTDYLPVTDHTAGAMLLLPGDILTDLEIYRLAILVFGLVLAVVLLRRWVSSWAALLGAILLFATVHLTQKFGGYRPESVAFDLLLFTVWLADRAMIERSLRIAGLAAVSSALVFMAHAEVFLVLCAALAGLAVGRATVVDGGFRRGRLGLRIPLGRTGVRSLAVAAGLVVAGIVLGSATAFAMTGRAGVFGYVPTEDARSASAVRRPDPEAIPPGWTFSDDPTWDFYVAAVAPNYLGMPPPATFRDSRLLPRTLLRVWTSVDGRTRPGLAVLALLALVPLIAWRWLDPRRRRAVLGWLVFGGCLVGGSYVLFAISSTYVPQRTGGVRLVPYLVFIPVVSAVVLAWGAGRRLAPAVSSRVRRRPRLDAPETRWLVRFGMASLAVVVVWAVAVAVPLGGREAALDPIGDQAYLWMRDNLPADARILANGYTDGSIAAVTGRVGIVDGRAVYLEDPAFLAESTALCLRARLFFANPAAPSARAFLSDERVTHVVVSTSGPLGRDIGGYPLFPTDPVALAASPALHLTRTFGDGKLLLYEVVPA